MDGEGSFKITIRHSNDGKYNWYQDSISVRMVEHPVIKFLHDKVGGNYNEWNEKGGIVYIWTMNAIESRKLCKKLLPYLILKKRQAEIIIEMGEIKQKSRRFQSDPDDIKNKKYELYYEMKQLHQRNYLVKPK